MKMVEDGLAQLDLAGRPSELYDPIVYFMEIGGKRLRPALCLAACELAGTSPENALNAALGLEVFHNFTLVHDDIMDQADVRRGKTTVHLKWNTNTAILAGDTMLVKAYQLMATVPDQALKAVLDTFSATAKEVCEGQQFDMSFETAQAVSEDEYLEMIRLKTSVLLGAALKIGAQVAGADAKTCEALYAFGVNIGIAFQIQDDLLDAFGNPEKVGKKAGGDIILNKQTLLRIHAWTHGDDVNRNRLEADYATEEEKVNSIRTLFEELGSRTYVEEIRDRFYQQALNDLKEVQGDPEILTELADFAKWLIKRDY